MATHRVRVEEVDAMEFTEAIGNDVAAASERGVKHKTGITFEQGRGYRFHGSQVSFGDFVVTSHGARCVMSAKDFGEKYEELPSKKAKLD